jgi:sugar lactone lactonase YvrE
MRSQSPAARPHIDGKSLLAASFLAAGLALILACCAIPFRKADCPGKLLQPAIAVELPAKYNTPDGMCLDGKGGIILSCPNLNDPSYPAKILRIDNNDRISEVITLPVHPETGRVGPLGVAVGPRGHLYVADNQSGFTSKPSSRLLRVVMEKDRAVRCEVLVEGFVQSNAVSVHGGCVFVTETKLLPDAVPLVSGVYRFSLSELDGTEPLRIVPGGGDEHLIVTVETHNADWRVGANGMGIDGESNLFFCNFGDAQIIKVVFDADGRVKSKKVFAEGQGMLSTDGIKFDPETGDIFVADFVGNAVHRVDIETGRVTTLARNGDTDGAAGALDRPSEVCLRGSRLYVANIDLPYGGNEYDAPHTISVIELGKGE